MKTLKDCYSVTDGRVELKQAAIEWIKELEVVRQTDIKERHRDDAHFIAGKIEWIKLFFNISEEHLK